MSRQTPESQIIMKLTPAAKSVDTMIKPMQYGDTGEGKTKAALQTADELKNFMGSLTTVNTVAMDIAKQTAEQEYLQNKGDWKEFSNKHPFLSHLNPHIENSFARAKAEEEINAIAGEFKGKLQNAEMMEEEDFRSLLQQTKQSMYQAATNNGVTYYDLEKYVVPKLNAVEQQSNESYYSARAKYKYETVKNSVPGTLENEWNTYQSEDLLTRVTKLQTVMDKYSYDLNPLDAADAFEQFVTNELMSESKNMAFNPDELVEATKQIKINGKFIKEIKPKTFGKIQKAADDYLGRRNYIMKQQQETEDWQKEQKRIEIEDNIINDAMNLDPAKFKQVLGKYSQSIKDARLGRETIKLLDELNHFNKIRYGLEKGAVDNNLVILSKFATQTANGSLNRQSLIKAVNDGDITQETAERMIFADSSEKVSKGKEGADKYTYRSITTNLTQSAFDKELQGLGLNFDMLEVNPTAWAIVNQGRTQWLSEYGSNLSAGLSTKDSGVVVARRKELAKAIKDQIEGLNKKPAGDNSLNNFTKPSNNKTNPGFKPKF